MRWPSLPLAAVLGVAALVPAAGCVPEDLDIVAFDERFEDCVECRWSLWYGGYALEPRVHPAEHALVFERATAMAIGLAIELYDEYSDGPWLEYTSDCAGAPQVSLSWGGVDAYVVEVVLPTAAEGTGPFERVYANLPPIPDPSPGTWGGARLTQLVLHADPWAGPCAIDNLRVMLSAPDDGW